MTTAPTPQPEALRLAAAITASGQFTDLETLDAAAEALARLQADNERLRAMPRQPGR